SCWLLLRNCFSASLSMAIVIWRRFWPFNDCIPLSVIWVCTSKAISSVKSGDLTHENGLSTYPFRTLLSRTYHCPLVFLMYTLSPWTICSRCEVVGVVVAPFCETSNCITSTLGNASSPLPIRLNVTLLTAVVGVGVPVPVVGVGVAFVVMACPEPLAFKSMCVDLSWLIAFELFCSSCKTVRLLPPGPPPIGLQALIRRRTVASATSRRKCFLCIITNTPLEPFKSIDAYKNVYACKCR